MSKSKDVTTTSTNTNSIPSWLTDAAQKVAGSVSGSPAYQPYTGQLTAPMSGNQTTAYNLVPGLLGQGANLVSSGAAGASAAAGFTAPQMTASSVNATTQGLLSPYTQNVVDTTNNEIDRQKVLQQQQNDGQAAAAHAFDGDRAGVVQAMNDRDFNTIKANTDAQLYGSGFTQAQNAALGIGQSNQNAAISGAGVNAYGGLALGSLGTALQGANMSDVNGLLTTGGVAQNTGQTADTNSYQNYMNNYLLPLQALQSEAGSLGSLPHDTSSYGTSTTPVTSNWGMGLLGAGLGVAGLAMPGGGSLISGLL